MGGWRGAVVVRALRAARDLEAALVAAHRAEFALLGVDVDTLRSRINV